MLDWSVNFLVFILFYFLSWLALSILMTCSLVYCITDALRKEKKENSSWNTLAKATTDFNSPFPMSFVCSLWSLAHLFYLLPVSDPFALSVLPAPNKDFALHLWAAQKTWYAKGRGTVLTEILHRGLEGKSYLTDPNWPTQTAHKTSSRSHPPTSIGHFQHGWFFVLFKVQSVGCFQQMMPQHTNPFSVVKVIEEHRV